jgi:hypothetical protein
MENYPNPVESEGWDLPQTPHSDSSEIEQNSATNAAPTLVVSDMPTKERASISNSEATNSARGRALLLMERNPSLARGWRPVTPAESSRLEVEKINRVIGSKLLRALRAARLRQRRDLAQLPDLAPHRIAFPNETRQRSRKRRA